MPKPQISQNSSIDKFYVYENGQLMEFQALKRGEIRPGCRKNICSPAWLFFSEARLLQEDKLSHAAACRQQQLLHAALAVAIFEAMYVYYTG